MSYQPMPSAQPPGAPAQRGPAPSTVVTAVRLMFARAALGVIGIIVLFATKNSLENRVRDQNLDRSSADINNLLDTIVTVAAVIGVIFIVLYVLLALQVRKGKNWARITTWVFAGLGALGLLTSFSTTQTPGSRVLSIISGLIDVAIIVLLALKASNDYFRKPNPYAQYGGYGPPGGYPPPPGQYPGQFPGQGQHPQQYPQQYPQQGQYSPPPGQWGPPPSS